jgi:phosphoribosylglycinamide formyltransferase-1
MNQPALAVAVLISGTGSNLKALIDAKASGRLTIDITLVISNRAEAPGLDHARAGNIPFAVVDSGTAAQQDREIISRLSDSGAELVILAGYMRIVGSELVEAFGKCMINLHPSLLPLYPGLDTYQQVLNAGDREHGGSIHFVTAELDAGPLIAQVRIPVLPEDSPSELAARLAPEEHRLLLATVELFTMRRVINDAGRVLLDGQPLPKPLNLNPLDNFD